MKTTPEMRATVRRLTNPAKDDYERAVLMLCDDFEEELIRLEKLVYVPGALKCAKCGFGLIKTNLHVTDGSFSANNEPDYCPNDGSPLWRVTERDAGNEMIDRAEKAFEEIKQLRAALNGLVDALAANDEDGLTEFAPQMQAARAALEL